MFRERVGLGNELELKDLKQDFILVSSRFSMDSTTGTPIRARPTPQHPCLGILALRRPPRHSPPPPPLVALVIVEEPPAHAAHFLALLLRARSLLLIGIGSLSGLSLNMSGDVRFNKQVYELSFGSIISSSKLT